MIYLYVDNFRGFTDSLIPIKDVNFFVGENSTGKTSLLSLIKLFSSNSFWLKQEFNSDEVQLGNFDDIVSAFSEKKDYFRIGIINEDVDDIHQAVLFEFKENNGLPALFHFQIRFKNLYMAFVVKGNKNYLKFNKIKEKNPASLLSIFRSQLKTFSGNIQDMKEIEEKSSSRNLKNTLLSLFIGEKDMELPPFIFYSSPFGNEVAWLAPIRTKPRRTYDDYRYDFTPEGEHTPYLIKKFFNTNDDKKFKNALEKFGKESGLFDTIEINEFSKSAVSPFELRIVLNKHALPINSVGYGVSQALPVVVEMISQPKNAWIAIQQPEVHLHPKAQASLGELLYYIAKEEKKSFLIETHSDFTIDRFRVNLNKDKSKNKPSSQILFFTRTDTGNHVYPIKIEDNGEFSQEQPPEFRNFFINEELDILGI